MDSITHRDAPYATKEGMAKVKNETDAKLRAEARQRRLAALQRVAGIWANRTDIPVDGLDYERELRDEWR